MRGDYIKQELNSQAFAVYQPEMEKILSVLNSGTIAKIEDTKEAHNSVEYETTGNVAVISIDGAMYKKDMNAYCMDVASYEHINKFITQAENDETIDTILFRVDTVGGSVAGVDEVGDRIFNSKKKTVTFYENTGASAGIWAFSASKEVYASELTLLGSIGVIVTYTESKKDKSTVTMVSKNAQNKNCSLNGDCKEKIETMINKYESIFYARVERNRGFDEEKIKSVFNNGDVIFATDALEAGFINGITSFQQLLNSLVTNTQDNLTWTMASMPTGNVTDKIETNSQGENMQDNIQDDASALAAQLSTVTAQLEEANAQREDALDKVSSFSKKLEDAQARLDAVPEIVAMAFEHNVPKSAAIEMVGCNTVAEAGLIALKAVGTSGSTSQAGDIGVDGEDVEKAEETAALAIARKMSVGE